MATTCRAPAIEDAGDLGQPRGPAQSLASSAEHRDRQVWTCGTPHRVDTCVCRPHQHSGKLLLLTAVAARRKEREAQIHHIWTVTHRGTEGQHQTGRGARGYELESEAATPRGTSMQVSSLGILWVSKVTVHVKKSTQIIHMSQPQGWHRLCSMCQAAQPNTGQT